MKSSELTPTKQSLIQQLNQLSGNLDMECDQNAETHQGLPEDRVAKMIFKSARSKIERLFELLCDSTQ